MLLFLLASSRRKPNEKEEELYPAGQNELLVLLTLSRWHSVTSAGINAITHMEH